MTEMLLALPPIWRLAALGAAAALALLILNEVGVVGAGAGLAAFAYTRGTGWDPVATGLATILVTVVAAVVHALLRPRAKCLRCDGKPREHGIGGFWRNCWLCGGSGQRRRLGAKVLSRHRGNR